MKFFNIKEQINYQNTLRSDYFFKFDYNYNINEEFYFKNLEDYDVKKQIINSIYKYDNNYYGDFLEDLDDMLDEEKEAERIEDSLFRKNYFNAKFLIILKKLIQEEQIVFENHNIIYDDIFDHFFFFLSVDFKKNFIKNRKILPIIKKGVSINPRKNSSTRDNIFSTMKQFYNVLIKKGNKKTIYKNFNIMAHNFYNVFNQSKEFYNYKDFFVLKSFLNSDPINYYNLEFITNDFMPYFDAMFNIKSKKNKRVKNKPDLKKYTYDIVYVRKEKRIKNTLKVLEVYSENFKNYSLWERLFWMYLTIILDKNNSFLFKRRTYIYDKSLRFFKKNKKKKHK